MAVTASMVKDLRERTGAGMMDCKKALTETDGDMDKAIEYLREKGLAKAAKKAGRIASEGLVKLAFTADGKSAAAVEVNSETDFVAKNEEFVTFVEDLAQLSLDGDFADLEAFMAADLKGEGTVQDVLNAKIAKIGENMNVRRFTKLSEPGVVYVGYVHGAGKIGVIVGLKTTASAEEVNTVGRDVAMQVASMSPKFVDETGVDPAWLEEIKEYTRRINRELNLDSEHYGEITFQDGIAINPYKKCELLYVPKEILHEIPIARCWSDIDRVISENEAIRAEVNEAVGSEWGKMRAAEKKDYLKQLCD